MKTSLVLLAAGRGKRFGSPKAFAMLSGETLLQRGVRLALESNVDEIIAVTCPGDVERVRKHIGSQSQVKIIEGGAERYESVKKGFEVSSGEVVLIHNVSNPMASTSDAVSVIDALQESDCAFVGQRVWDTIRRVAGDTKVQTFDRTDVWRAQTPQGFRREVLEQIYQAHRHIGLSDEIQGAEQLGFRVKALETHALNIKVTTTADIELLKHFLRPQPLVGIGEDSHRFSDSGTLRLAGVDVSGYGALEGNSDADVVLHALFNAVSSALGMGSLGSHADRLVESGQKDSVLFLKAPFEMMEARGYRLSNLALSFECLRPSIDPLRDELKQSLSRICDLSPDSIGISATSGEGLSGFGRGEGIRCIAAVSLLPKV